MDKQAGRLLLQELERWHGTHRLDLGPFPIDHGDSRWSDAIFGPDSRNLTEHARHVCLTMFDNPLVNLLQCSAYVLLRNSGDLLPQIDTGLTSIPIVNACALRRGDACVVGITNRLCTALAHANALAFLMEQECLSDSTVSPDSFLRQIRTILRCSSSEAFDEVLLGAACVPSVVYYRIGIQLSNVQLLFVLLHEYGHLACGHLADNDFWQESPFGNPGVMLFSGSIDAEHEADEYAVIHLLDQTVWSGLPTDMWILNPPDDLARLTDLPRETVPALVTQLLTWFFTMNPSDRKSYYKVPRSHPHPLDRVDRVIDIVHKKCSGFDVRRFMDAVQVQQRLYAQA